jgi:hypothetical protein
VKAVSEQGERLSIGPTFSRRCAVALRYYAGIPSDPQSQSFMGKARRLKRERQSVRREVKSNLIGRVERPAVGSGAAWTEGLRRESHHPVRLSFYGLTALSLQAGLNAGMEQRRHLRRSLTLSV